MAGTGGTAGSRSQKGRPQKLGERKNSNTTNGRSTHTNHAPPTTHTTQTTDSPGTLPPFALVPIYALNPPSPTATHSDQFGSLRQCSGFYTVRRVVVGMRSNATTGPAPTTPTMSCTRNALYSILVRRINYALSIVYLIAKSDKLLSLPSILSYDDSFHSVLSL